MEIIGLIFTIFFGIPSYLALRKDKNSIVFLETDNIDLYNKILTNFSNIKITYNEHIINEGLFLLRGIILFIGSKDVTKEMIQKGLGFKLSSNGTWKETRIISSTQDIDVQTKIIQDKLLFDFNLLKNGDYVYFEALGETSTHTYTINHRIANLKKIQIEQLSLYKKSRFDFFYIISFLFPLFILILYLWTGYSPIKIKSSDIESIYYDSTSKQISEDKFYKTETADKKYSYVFTIDSMGNLTSGTPLNMNSFDLAGKPTDRLTIFEALAQCGILDIFDVKPVWILRDSSGQRIFTMLNLNDKEIFKSRYFYLQNNDIIYIQPTNSNFFQGPNNPTKNKIDSLAKFGISSVNTRALIMQKKDSISERFSKINFLLVSETKSMNFAHGQKVIFKIKRDLFAYFQFFLLLLFFSFILYRSIYKIKRLIRSRQIKNIVDQIDNIELHGFVRK